MAAIEIYWPVGDPTEMRASAARMAFACDSLRAAARAIDARCAAMLYRCPAGDRFRDEIAHRRRDLDHILEDLTRVRLAIGVEAAHVEAAEAGCRRLRRLLDSGASEVARDAGALEREVRRLLMEV